MPYRLFIASKHKEVDFEERRGKRKRWKINSRRRRLSWCRNKRRACVERGRESGIVNPLHHDIHTYVERGERRQEQEMVR